MIESKDKKNNDYGLKLTMAIVLIIASFAGGMKYRSYKTGKASQVATASVFKMSAPVVKVTDAELMNVTATKEYIGYVEAIETVDLMPQVSGCIEKVNFVEGTFVNKGDSLFTIEQIQYKANLELREAQLAQAQAKLVRSEKYLNRLKAADEKSISQSDFETAESDVLAGEAEVKQCQANIKLAEIDLMRTVIKAPISGVIGQALITEGNYVSNATRTLAKIVKVDPIRIVFSMSDKDYFNVAGKLARDEFAVKVKLPDGTVFPVIGKRDFDDNQIDSSTATIAVRAKFDNPDRRLVSGGYVTVMLEDTQSKKAFIVPHSAIVATADGKAVYVVDSDGTAQVRPIVVESENQNGVVVKAGLKNGDTYIVQGIQKIRAGATVSVIR